MAGRLTLAALDRYAQQAHDQSPPPMPPLPKNAVPMGRFRSGRAEPQAPLPPHRPAEQPKPAASPGPVINLTARVLKVTTVLDPVVVSGLRAPDTVRVALRIQVDGRTITASIACKSLRKALGTIREHGADGVVAILQGKLAGEAIEECVLVVQAKAPKPPPAETSWP